LVDVGSKSGVIEYLFDDLRKVIVEKRAKDADN